MLHPDLRDVIVLSSNINVLIGQGENKMAHEKGRVRQELPCTKNALNEANIPAN